jgi:hypothetical protein
MLLTKVSWPFRLHPALLLLSALVFQLGCSSLQKKLDPQFRYKTEAGWFSFQVPFTGGWVEGPGEKGVYQFGVKAKKDGTTALAFVRHAPIMEPGRKKLTNSQALAMFQHDIEQDSKSGRVETKKSEFIKKKYLGADCLVFKQLGQDNGVSPSMTITNDGMICLHPKDSNRYIWMTVSERRALLAKPLVPESEEEQFFNSLQFE